MTLESRLDMEVVGMDRSLRVMELGPRCRTVLMMSSKMRAKTSMEVRMLSCIL